jgi:hypothetical protein
MTDSPTAIQRLTELFCSNCVESRPIARGWPFKTFGSVMHSFFSAQPQYMGAPIKNPNAAFYCYYKSFVENNEVPFL